MGYKRGEGREEGDGGDGGGGGKEERALLSLHLGYKSSDARICRNSRKIVGEHLCIGFSLRWAEKGSALVCNLLFGEK